MEMASINGAETVFLTVLNFLYLQVLYSSVLFAIVYFLSRSIKAASPLWQAGLWSLVLLRLVIPPDVSSPVSLRHMFLRQHLGIESIISPETRQDAAPPGGTRIRSTSPIPADNINPHPPRIPGQPAPELVQPSYAWLAIPLSLWLLGVIFHAYRYLKRYRFHRALCGRAVPVRLPGIIATIGEMRRAFGIRRRVRVVASKDYPSPFTLGWIRPVIFIPSGLLDPWRYQTCKVVLAHEMAHIRHWDDLRIKCQAVLQIIYFFHPVIRYANRKVDAAREMLRDATVVAKLNMAPSVYGRSILEIAGPGSRPLDSPQSVAGFGARFRSLERRLAHVLKGEEMKKRQMIMTAVIVTLMGIVVLPMAPGHMHAAYSQTDNQLEWNRLVDSLEGWFARTFNPAIHSREKLPGRILGTDANPEVKPPFKELESFSSALDKGLRPGIVYTTGGEPVRAVAAGIVHFIGERPQSQGDPGGFYIRVTHDNLDGLTRDFYPRMPLYRPQVYRSTYYNLAEVAVAHWQAVERGQVLGHGRKFDGGGEEKFTLVLEERGNWVNPDSLGAGLDRMQVWGGEAGLEIDLETMNARLDAQKKVVAELLGHYAEKEGGDIRQKIHTVIDTEKFKNYPVKWSTVEQFRYLSYRYEEDPAVFPELSLETFNRLRTSFHANQPIVLTLPFK